MGDKNNRLKRISEQIRRELAQLIQQELKDPRVDKFVTITAVRVSKEFENAKIFVTSLSDASEIENTVLALNKASGFLRRELGHRMKMRTIPHLNFVYDVSVEHGRYLSNLIESAVDLDKQKHNTE